MILPIRFLTLWLAVAGLCAAGPSIAEPIKPPVKVSSRLVIVSTTDGGPDSLASWEDVEVFGPEDEATVICMDRLARPTFSEGTLRERVARTCLTAPLPPVVTEPRWVLLETETSTDGTTDLMPHPDLARRDSKLSVTVKRSSVFASELECDAARSQLRKKEEEDRVEAREAGLAWLVKQQHDLDAQAEETCAAAKARPLKNAEDAQRRLCPKRPKACDLATEELLTAQRLAGECEGQRQRSQHTKDLAATALPANPPTRTGLCRSLRAAE